MEYPRNYLKKVICRVDFPAPLGFTESLPNDLKARFRELLPVLETQQFQSADFEVTLGEDTDPEFKQRNVKGIEWRFHSENRERHLVIGPDFLAIEFDVFTRFVDFNSVLTSVFDALIEAKGNLEVRRLGLRFINEVKVDDGAPTDWQDLISSKLIEMFDVPDNPECLMRIMGLAELIYGQIAVRFQYGMPNPDYPAPLRQKLFILDYDAYSVSGIELRDAAGAADECNQQVYKLFEQSIGEGLRTLMTGDVR